MDELFLTLVAWFLLGNIGMAVLQSPWLLLFSLDILRLLFLISAGFCERDPIFGIFRRSEWQLAR